MSSFNINYPEDFMSVSSIVITGETEQRLMVGMTMDNSKIKLELCPFSKITIKTFIGRFKNKLNQAHEKIKSNNLYFENNILIKVDGIIVPDHFKCGEVFEEDKNISLHIKDTVIKVFVNAPIVKNMRLGSTPYKGLMIYPYILGKGHGVSILDANYLWYRIDSNEITKVGNEIAYIPTASDVNCRLKLVCHPYNERGQYGPKAEIESSTVLDNIIQTYPFESRLEKKPNNSIRVVSYNILAAGYIRYKEVKPNFFSYCSPEILATTYRTPLIMKELIAYTPDILCLQEVEINLFPSVLSPLLKTYLNMDGVFFKKCSRFVSEGLCCFYSSDKFKLLNEFNFKLNDIASMTSYCGTVVEKILSDELWKKALIKATILQIVVLELISDTNQMFIICNTHLISDPDGNSIKLLQALVELTIINQIKQNIKNDYPERNVSVIFCGDFNSTPDNGVYDFVTSLALPEKYNDVEILNNLKSIIGLKMECAYDVLKVDYSTFTKTFSGLLDYIFFTQQHLELIQVLPMPLHEHVIQHALPSVLFPSDHLALVADLKVK